MPLANILGRVAYVFEEENYDTDRIVGPENVGELDPDVLARLALRAQDPAFASLVRAGDVLVGSHNFGYGHPHYPPMLAMRRLGIAAVIAESFAPGYWHEEMQEGFPQITCPGILAAVARWDVVEIDFAAATVTNRTRGVRLAFEPFSATERLMLESGGLSGYLHLGEVSE